ncbi:MAG TPA: hypothetical protein VJ574_02825, partial [Candidatus Bathyarchaeia archaeon]|nr:hypothetical protein [Candidatus Bathyarchaeia archaeon]
LAFPSLAYLEPRKSDRVVVSALNEIPSNASVSVMPEFFPHICNRLDAYPYFKQGVDYVLIDVYSWWYTATLPRPADSAPKWSAANVSVDYGIMINSNGILLYKRGYKGPVVFEGVSGEYGGHDVTVATGGFSRDNITIGNSIVTVDVLLHGTADNGPLFFYTSPTVFPPGIYNVTALMRASSVTSAEVVSFLVTEEPEHAEIHSERINGTAFTPQGAWGNLMFSFALEKPAPIMISVYVSNSTQVYFYSMKYSQVSGGM